MSAFWQKMSAALTIAALGGCSSADTPGAPVDDAQATTPTPSTNTPATSSDGAPATDPPATTSPPPPPLGAEYGQWTWLDVPDMKCGNGESTGIGLNAGTGGDLLIFLMGGGGCWDELTCSGIGTASHIKDGYKADDFKAELEGQLAAANNGGMFDRTAATNPFKNSSFVFVPYCTGDVHAGDATQQWLFPPRTMHYAGRKNVEAMLATVVPAYQSVSRVTFSGSSAGGFGAIMNYWKVQEAFGKVRVDLIDDSGPPFEQKDMPLLSTWKSAWNMDGAFPPGCTECRTNIASISAYYSTTYPSSRFSLLSYDNDNVISVFFLSTKEAFANNLRAMVDTRIEPLPNFKYFIVPGAHHTMLSDAATTSGNVLLGPWLTQMVTYDAAWANVDNE